MEFDSHGVFGVDDGLHEGHMFATQQSTSLYTKSPSIGFGLADRRPDISDYSPSDGEMSEEMDISPSPPPASPPLDVSKFTPQMDDFTRMMDIDTVPADGTPDNMMGPSSRETPSLNESNSTSTPTTAPIHKPKSLSKQLDIVSEALRTSSSSRSVLSDSDLSSPPPTMSSKATTPVEPDNSVAIEPTSQPPPPKPIATTRNVPRRKYDIRPKVSIPPDMTPQAYAEQCIAAAEASRLNPYALHEDEWNIFRDHISHAQVTTYLNIRNGILRLWISNSLVMVAREEAIGCAKDSRWFDVANVCYEWLLRNGYINFGCAQLKTSRSSPGHNSPTKPKKKRTRIIIIGAGMSGLGCARQLDGLFKQHYKKFRDRDEDLPEVIILEGRERVGGRVYSRDFNSKPTSPNPAFQGRATAEMGGMIITGFSRGNPINVLVRGQLALPYHFLRSQTTLYDNSGQAVDPVRDEMVEKLHNECLERVSEYKWKPKPLKLIEGNRDLIDEGKDSASEGGKTIAYVEETLAQQPHHALPVSQQNMAPRAEVHPVSTDRLTGRVHVAPGAPATKTAAYRAAELNWQLKPGVTKEDDIDLGAATTKKGATLGSVMDEAITQFQKFVDFRPQDFRMFNWHVANLEYSNAINYNQLSLPGWDIDAGYEWEGKHSMVLGGYQQVPRCLMLFPTPLDVRFKSPVARIRYTPDLSDTNPSQATVQLEDGTTIEADYVINTIPLGVLKHGNVQFDPPLPPRKSDAIARLGFGILNKVILVYKKPFWDEDRDIFGMLRSPAKGDKNSISQSSYAKDRGRFFQWFNVSNTSGVPCLLALMAGDAGNDTETSHADDLVSEATHILRKIFGEHNVPEPEEAVVTRWGSDPFARGSYSSTGPDMHPDDYDAMQLPCGNLLFAGEHTSGTHPATVHGAYMSGLRAAADIANLVLGPIEVPVPLILPKDSNSNSNRLLKRKTYDIGPTAEELYNAKMWEHIVALIGPCPEKPLKPHCSGWSWFTKDEDYKSAARKRCNEGRRSGKGTASSTEIRNMMSRMWKKEMTDEEKAPFEARSAEVKASHAEAVKVWDGVFKEWNSKATEMVEGYVRDNPFVPDPMMEVDGLGGLVGATGRRSKAVVASYKEPGSDVEMEDE